MKPEDALKVERNKIDQLDLQMVQLLEKRMDTVSRIAAIKGKAEKNVLDSEREKIVLEQVAARVNNPGYKETISNTFKDIMKHSRAYQQKKLNGEGSNE